MVVVILRRPDKALQQKWSTPISSMGFVHRTVKLIIPLMKNEGGSAILGSTLRYPTRFSVKVFVVSFDGCVAS